MLSPMPALHSFPEPVTLVRATADGPVSDSAETVLAALESAPDRISGSEIPVVSGTVLDGRYLVGDVLAEGGMGVVCLGQHMELGQRVAIKFLRNDISDRPSVVQRFLNEGRAAACLKSEHVVRVMDVGQLDSGRPYLVMEHLDGTDLDGLLEREGAFGVDQTVEYILQVCTALSEAHANGIVHRDIKPENLFLVDGPGRILVKVLDFGLAKRIESAHSAGLTGPSDSMGSPYYMSPEQIVTPHLVDARTDIWSLGVVLYRFLTGTLPFRGDTITEVYAHALNAQPESVEVLRPELDPELGNIVRRCLEKKVELRYQSILELSRDLETYRDARQASPRSSEPPVFEDNTPIKIPGVHSRWPLAMALLVVAAGGVYLADGTGRFDTRALSDRLSSNILGSDRVRSVTDGWLTIPRLAVSLPSPMPRAAFAPMLLGPASGVFTQDAAVDARGAPTLRAEREPESNAVDEGAGDAADPGAADQRKATYRQYLDQNGLVPLKEALEKLSGVEQAQ
jgi:serine/threonine protein kinase